MSLSDDLAAMQAAGNAFIGKFKTALASKATEALQADSASTLGGKTTAQQLTAMNADIDTHAARTNNPHSDAANALAAPGAYKSSEIDAKLLTVSRLNALPISRYGELSYLPTTVSGSFEGASTNFGQSQQEARNYPGIVEDDGTFVFLRNGTNGSVFGVYYAYTKNILTATDLTPTRTNRKYAPAYFPSGYTAGYVTRSDLKGGCIFGRLQNSSGTLGDWFLSITHGTFDDSKHTGCTIAAANFPAAATANAYPEAILGTNAVYLLWPNYDNGNGPINPVEWSVYTIPLSSINAGGSVTPTKLTGWSTTNFAGAALSTTNLQLAAKGLSQTASDNPYVYLDPNQTTVSALPFYPNQLGLNSYSAQDPSGNIRTRVMAELVVGNTATGQQVVWNSYFTFIWNPNTKNAQVEAAYRGTNYITVTSGQIAISGPCLFADRSQYSTGNWFTGDTMYYHPQGWWISVIDQAIVDYPCYVARAQLQGGAMTGYNALVGSNKVQGNKNTVYQAAYGSSVGGGLMGCSQLPGGAMLVFGSGRNAAGNWVRDLMWVYKGADSYTYKSQYFGTLTGFAPNVNRAFLSDLGKTPLTYASAISEINSAGTVTCTGAQYMQGIQDTGFVSCDVNLNLTGSTSIAPAVYTVITNAMLSALGASAPGGSYVTIVVPQNASIPPFAVLNFIDAAKNEKAALGELAITAGARNGAVTGMSLVSVSSLRQHYTFVNKFIPGNQNYQYAFMGAGVTIYETADSWLIGGSSKHFIDRVLWSGTYSYRFAIPKSSNRPDWSTLVTAPTWTTFETLFNGAVPGKGFGYYDQEATQSDGTTKLVFKPTATNLSTFNSWATPASSSWSVQTSQDVAQGWIVYFTTSAPLIMNGQSFTLAPYTADLTTVKASPANTTFYVYIQQASAGAQPRYVIVTAPVNESQGMMYIGKIITNATQISSITIGKVTRLDLYRVSPVAQGEAISASSGTPDTAATLNWT